MSDNAIITTRGYGTNGGTAILRLDLSNDSWSTLSGSRPAPSGTDPNSGNQVAACDGTYIYFILQDGKLYKSDFAGAVTGPLAGGAVLVASFVNNAIGMTCDGKVVYITFKTSMIRYEISTNALLPTIPMPIGTVVGGTIDFNAITWDEDRTLYIAFRDSSGHYQFTAMDVLTQVFDTSLPILASQVALHLTVLGNYVYLNSNGNLYRFDRTAKTWSAQLISGAGAGSCWAVSDTDLLILSSQAASPTAKRYNVNTNALATLTAPGVGLGSWAAAAYTIPFIDPFAHADSGGTTISSVLPTIGTVKIGSLLVAGTYYVKALKDVGHCYVTAVSPTDTAFLVSASPSGPFVAKADLGAMTNGQTKPYYVTAQATGGQARTDDLRVVFSET